MSATQTCVAIQKGHLRFSLQSRRSLRLPACYLAIAALGAAIACSAARAESIRTTARWLGASDGSWDDSTRWSTPQFPNNGSPDPADSYSAVIDATGSEYSVRLEDEITLDKLTINSADAGLWLRTGTLQAREGIDVQAGRLFVSQSGSSAYPVIRDTHITAAEGALVRISSGGLDNVTLTGTFSTYYQDRVHVKNGLTLDDGLLQVDGDLYFRPGEHSLGGKGTVQLSMHAELVASSNATVTIGADVLVTGGGLIFGYRTGCVINNGVIRATDTPTLLEIRGSFENRGRIELTDNHQLKIRIEPGWHHWKNDGVITMDSGELVLMGNYDQSHFGTIHRSGGTITLGETVENVGKTLRLDAALGSCKLEGAIIGGTVETLDGTELYVGKNYPRYYAAMKEGVTLNGRLRLQDWSLLTIRDGITLNGLIEVQSHNRTELVFEGSQTIVGSGEIAFTEHHGGGMIYPSGGTFTIGPEVTIRTDGDGGLLGRAGETETDGILNLGTISAETAGKTIRMVGANFGNQGLVQAVGGGTVRIEDRALRDVISGTLVSGQWVVGDDSSIELGSASILTNNGDVTLRGPKSKMPAMDAMQHNRGKLTIENGRNFTTTGNLDNMGQLAVGRDCTLRVGGDFRQQDLGKTVIRIGGPWPGVGHGLLDVGGAATLDGTLEVLLADGYVPALGDTFDVLDFDTLTLTPDVGDLLALDALPSGLYWDTGRFAADGSLTVVPEPGTLFTAIVFLLGLLIWSRHGRRPPGTSRVGILPAVLAAVTAGLIGCATATAAPTDVYWQNGGAGDWFDPLNWDTHVPVYGDSAYIDNGGTAQVVNDAPSANLPNRIYVGYDSSGTLEHTAGEWQSDHSSLWLGANSGSSGTYKIGGTAVVNFSGDLRTGSGNALIEQTGGNLTVFEYYLREGGVHKHSGGMLTVREELYVWGGYELSGTGHLVSNDPNGDGVTIYATFRQTGGRFDVSETLIREGGTYRMEGGDYSAAYILVKEGELLLSGGVFDAGRLYVLPPGSNNGQGGRCTVSGGTLVVSDSVSVGSAPISFEPAAWSLDVQGGIANFENSNMPDVSAASLTSQPGTLTILPAGIDTSQFASYNPLGIVHIKGSTLHVPSGISISGSGEISDHLVVEGTIQAYSSHSRDYRPINVTDGINVHAGAAVYLGQGTLIVEDQISGMDGGSLHTRDFYVGKSGSGRFIHGGGYIGSSGDIYVGYGPGADGYYELNVGANVQASEIKIASDPESTGHFRQLGGHTTVSTRASVRANGVCELIDGRFLADDIWVEGLFVQTGGFNHGNAGADVGTLGEGHGRFELRGGTHETGYSGLQIGGARYSTGTYIVSGTGKSIGEKLEVFNGLFRQEGGTASFRNEVKVAPSPGQTGRIELVAGDFTGETLTLSGSHPDAVVFDQSGGIAAFEEMFAGAAWDNVDFDSGKCLMRGGELVVSGTATFGAWRGFSYDRPKGFGVLEVAGGSATFGNIVLGEEFGYGGSGTLNITDAAAQMRVAGSLKLGSNAVLTAVPGSSLHVGGLIFAPSAFENESTDAAALAGLGNLALLFDGGPYALNSLEVAGEDLGLRAEGLTLNFALDTLRVGGDDVAHLQLIDVFDNQQDEQLGNESLYVRRLVVGPDSWLDLNGLNLYCLSASIDAKAVVMENGGVLAVVPEPSTLVLLWLGLSSVFAWGFFRRRRSGRATQ